jgi:transposase
MGQRARILTEIWGFQGWKVKDVWFEDEDGKRLMVIPGYGPGATAQLVIVAERKWAPRCGQCGAICPRAAHEKLEARRWRDLPWAGRPAVIEASLIRVKCRRCQSAAVEMAAWAEPRQRQTHRLQQHLALEAASMPVLHVAARHGLSWRTVRRAEGAALARWDATRTPPPLEMVGIDEKYLGRRHRLDHEYVTIVSNLATGEPIWIGPDRRETTVRKWLATLTPEQKRAIKVVAMDMHRPFANAILGDPKMKHVAIVHDPFHIVKRVGEAVSEVRKDAFFRAGPEKRAIGRGTRWLVLRAWERLTPPEQGELRYLLAQNKTLARAYQLKEEIRQVLRAPDGETLAIGLRHILRRTQRHGCKPLRSLHDSLVLHWHAIIALGEHRPPVGRVEALNNNWETLVRRARGYRDHDYLLLKLRFMIANPIREPKDVVRFQALGLPAPQRAAA